MDFFKTYKVHHETYLLVRSPSHFIFFFDKNPGIEKNWL